MARDLGRLMRHTAPVLEDVGVTWGDLYAVEAEQPTILLPFPPLFTEARLGDEPLQPYLEVKAGCEFEEFVAVYEAFIASYIHGRVEKLPPPAVFVQKQLRISRQDAEMLFGKTGRGRGRRLYDMLMLLQSFAAVAAYTYDYNAMESTSDVFAVSVGGYRFGLDSGRAITNLKPVAIPRQLIANPRGELRNMRRGRGVEIQKPDNMAKAFEHVRRLRKPELASLQLALQILLWRSTRRGSIDKSIHTARAPAGWMKTLEMAKRFEDFDNPYQELRSLFVPNLLTPREFRKEFGEPLRKGRRPAKARREVWHMRLDQLRRMHT